MKWVIFVRYVGVHPQWQKLMGGFISPLEAITWLYNTYTPTADFWSNVRDISVEEER